MGLPGECHRQQVRPPMHGIPEQDIGQSVSVNRMFVCLFVCLFACLLARSSVCLFCIHLCVCEPNGHTLIPQMSAHVSATIAMSISS